MAEAQATPPAQGGIDQKALETAVAAAVAAAMPAVAKQLGDAIAQSTAQQQAAAKDAPAADKKGDAAAPKAITIEDITKLLDQRDGQRQQTAQRQAFVESTMKDVPPAYQAKLGSDPTKWASEEQAIRTELRADLEKMGVKAPPVSGQPQTGKAPEAQVDYSKLNAAQKIELGLKQLGVPGAPTVVTADAATTTGAAAAGAAAK